MQVRRWRVSPPTPIEHENLIKHEDTMTLIGIYCIRNIVNSKCYIGQSRYLKDRITSHLNCKKGSPLLVNAISKYGKNIFKAEILEICSEDLLDDRERHWIAALDCIKPNGYNLEIGGRNGLLSIESRQKMSDSQKKRLEDPNELRRLSEISKGRVPWNKGKKGLQVAWNKGKKMSKPSWNKGKTLSIETRKRISDTLKRKGIKPPSQKGKKWRKNNGLE